MVTVIIPTCSRPHFLREALESVRQQTALDRIGQVIVSENGGCRDSQAVCEELFQTITTPDSSGGGCRALRTRPAGDSLRVVEEFTRLLMELTGPASAR
jgi:GT2 family glycosyltransferase